MTDVNSIPTAAPSQDKAQVEEYVRSEEFLDEIMGNMVKTGQEPLQKITSSNRSQAVELQNQGQEQVSEVVVPVQEQTTQSTQEESAPESTENLVDTQTNQQDPYEKRWRDSQAMIGRQSNEIGQLRKQMAEFQKKMETPPTAIQENTKPYYEKLVEMPEKEIAKLLIQDALSKGEDLDSVLAIQQARVLKTSVQAQLDIVKDALKPVNEIKQRMEEQRLISQKDAEWHNSHPEAEKRKQAMTQFINSAYPEGLAIKNEYGETIGMRADPYVVAHMAYEFAGKIGATAQQVVENQENQRIAAGRSLNTSTQGAVQGQTTAPKPKVDALKAESDRVFEQIAPSLMRR